MDDYRFRTQQSPRTEAPMNSLVSPPRNGNRLPQPDPRTTLPRRFTTDSGRVPTLSTLTSLQRPVEPQEYTTALNKKKQEYETLLEQKRRFEAEMRKFELQQRQDEAELRQMELDLTKNNVFGLTGHQSEPTTPPEYRETSNGFPTMFSRPNRYSLSSLNSPPGLFNNRSGRSGSQLQSPQSGILPSQSRAFAFDDHLPSRSVPGTRRNSDEDEKEEALRQDPTSHRSTNAHCTCLYPIFPFTAHGHLHPTKANKSWNQEQIFTLCWRLEFMGLVDLNDFDLCLNRYSLPVTRRGNPLYDNIDQTNAAGFLFRDDEATMEQQNYSGLDNTTGDEGFPKLIAQKGNPNRCADLLISQLSTSSLAVDLTSFGAAGSEASNGWNKMTSLHRPQQSLSNLDAAQMSSADSVASGHGSTSSDANTIGARSGFRHSLDLTKQQGLDFNYMKEVTPETNNTIKSPPTSQALPPKLQTSFSANDIHAANKAANSINMANANAHAQQHFHNHNASIGRIPPGAIPKQHNRELSSDGHIPGMPQSATYPSISTALHANAPAFGPSGAISQAPAQNGSLVSSPSTSSGPGYPSYYGNANYNNPASPNGSNYNMGMLMQGMSNMNINGYPHQSYTGYAPMFQPAQPRDSQQRVIQARRAQDNEAMSRFNGAPLTNFHGSILELCKDQHGCRYLQKQLENRIPHEIHQIWQETNAHVVDLMMDPFGNYLCQKLLEYCTDDERTLLIRNAADSMTRIAFNQHGTRALQKMIEFVTLPEHVQIIIEALRYQVVELIKDLNGNHVIQKCLNKLSSEDNQFIFEAVGNNCIDVGTHRHGCCVLQRCIDHAAGDQKITLISQITENATRLVQDPFGNYVVQYIIDLNEPSFTEPLVIKFLGSIGRLSRHKFSSNVMEKCLRCSSDQSKDMMVQEILVPGEIDRLLRDNYGNYVVQTALEHCPLQTKIQLIETIRPIIPNVRGTPYARRIQAKIIAHDSGRGGSNNSSGQTTPSDATSGQISLRNAGMNGGNGAGALRGSIEYGNGMPRSRGQSTYQPGNSAPPQPPRLNQGYTYPGSNVQPGSAEGQFF
ncbi:RNA-binding protein (pumilio domain-containing protein) [Seiridium cupressi]